MVRKFFSSLAGQLFIALLGLAIVSACSLDTKAKTALNLVDTNWTLKTLDGTALNSERPLSLRFSADHVNGYAGCNSFFANYTASSDGVFGLGTVGMTKMACLGTRDQQEREFLQRLNQVKQYSMTREQLLLLDAQRKVLLAFNTDKAK